jgi:hypothetical protein
VSGIVATVSGDDAPLDRARLVEMTAALAFRGPGAQEVWAGDGIGLGCASRGLVPDFIRLRAKTHMRDTTPMLLAHSIPPSPDLLAATPTLADYVDIRQVRESLSNLNNPGLRMDLPPLCLANWLQRIEQVSHSIG